MLAQLAFNTRIGHEVDMPLPPFTTTRPVADERSVWDQTPEGNAGWHREPRGHAEG
jgi:hypothetical protein